MSANLLHTIILSGVFLTLFVSAEILFHKFNWKAEASRKYVHGSTGILTMLFPPLLTSHWYVLALCGSFLVILILSKKLGFLQSIHGINRVTRGSLLYPIVVYFCYLIYQHYGLFMFYYIPILILALSDPMAAVVGKKLPYGEFTIFKHAKTLSGCSGFFFSAILISSTLLILLEEISIIHTLIIAVSVSVSTTISEAITHKGYDNLTIPASAVITLIFIHSIISI